MRWEDLFADLEAQAAAEGRAELEAEVADRTRREAARLRVVDRLRGASLTGAVVTVHVRGGGVEVGQVATVGADWALLTHDGVEVLVTILAVEMLSGLGTASAEPGSEGAVAGRLRLGHALRAIARDRAEVRLTTLGGSVLVGAVERVGRDHVEVVEHPPGEPRLRRAARVVPFEALATVRVCP